MSYPPYTISDVCSGLNSPEINRLPAPPYTPATTDEKRPSIFLGVESMRRHTTDEGNQIQLAFKSKGFRLYGHGFHPYSEVDVKEILSVEKPPFLILQDKREWDVPVQQNNFRDANAMFRNVTELKKHTEIFKATILKDAHHHPHYHSCSAEEVGCHSWIIYYHPRIVSTLAPYIRPEHCIRTYHSIRHSDVPEINWSTTKSLRKGCLLSGAISGAYPLRTRLMQELSQLPQTEYLQHPGYHANGCNTPEYLQTLVRYRVAICTASRFGYALRKLIEATACGCKVITDLPADEVLPYIDGNLIRVHPMISTKDMAQVIASAIEQYDPVEQEKYALKTLLNYNYITLGSNLVNDLIDIRGKYDAVLPTV